MEEMKAFVLWFVQEFPPVLLVPPFSAFTGIMILFFLCSLISRIKYL